MMYILIAIDVLLVAALTFGALQINMLWQEVRTKRQSEQELRELVSKHNKWIKQISDDGIENNKLWRSVRDEVIDTNRRLTEATKEMAEYQEIMKRLP